MRNNRMIELGVLIAVSALTVTACGGDSGAGTTSAASTSAGVTTESSDPVESPTAATAQLPDPFNVSMSIYTEAAPLFQVIHKNLDQQIADNVTGVEVKWYDNAGDPAKMLENVQLQIADNPAAIVIYPVSTATKGVGKILGESGIPCVAMNLDVAECTFLNIDNRKLGEESANIIGAIAKDRGWNASNTTILIGQNAAAGEQVNDCVRYFYTTIAPILGMEEVDPATITPKTTKIGANAIQFDGQSTLQPSFDAVKNILPSIPEGNNIILYTVNNDSTMGALRAMEDAGRGGDDDTLVGGLGGDEGGLNALREDPRWVAEGDIFISYWGQYAIAAAQARALGVTPTVKVTPFPQQVLSKDTVGNYYDVGSTKPKLLPALVPDNEWLSKGGFLQVVGNVEGL
jgi:ribose transport system substrate-binding protein